MAQIISYPLATPVSTDYVVGTQKSTTGAPINPTKNFTVDSVVQAGLGYIAYSALLSQITTNAPTATVLKNNTGYTYTWSRTGPGAYTITASGNAFTANKTAVVINRGSYTAAEEISWFRTSETGIAFNAGADTSINNGFIEIRIYS